MKETTIDEVRQADDGLSEAGITDVVGASLTEPGVRPFWWACTSAKQARIRLRTR